MIAALNETYTPFGKRIMYLNKNTIREKREAQKIGL